MLRLQQASAPAVSTLFKIMADSNAPMAVRARCAYYIPDQNRKGVETEEIEARVTALEEAAGEQGKRSNAGWLRAWSGWSPG
jgi:hypothetical protein